MTTAETAYKELKQFKEFVEHSSFFCDLLKKQVSNWSSEKKYWFGQSWKEEEAQGKSIITIDGGIITISAAFLSHCRAWGLTV